MQAEPPSPWHVFFEVDPFVFGWQDRSIKLFPHTERIERITKLEATDRGQIRALVCLVPGEYLEVISEPGKLTVTFIQIMRDLKCLELPLNSSAPMDLVLRNVREGINRYWESVSNLLCLRQIH